jgi:hypothetical protein
VNRRRWKGRATRLHTALYIAAEGAVELYGADDDVLSDEEATELAQVFKDIADAMYFGEADALARLAKQFKATNAELDRDGELPDPDA